MTNHRFLKALRKEPVDCTPVWMMRQAGRYLPEYRALREKAGSFLNLCQNPDLATEITLQPLARFPLDAAIIFSDILTIPDAMGLGLHFVPGGGPQFERPVQDAAAVQAIGIPDPEADLAYVTAAIRQTKQALADKTPLIGFAGSPWTVATYMVEGKPSKDFHVIKGMLYRAPDVLQSLLSKLAEATVLYLLAQIEAGADAVMVFDTWGGQLTGEAYQQFSLQHMQRIVAAVKAKAPNTPVILFTKQGNLWLESIAATGCDGVGVDWTVNIGEARQRIGAQVALQGNLDPAILFSSPESIRAEVAKVLASFGAGTGHVFNLGHGVSQFVSPEHVAAMVDAVHELSVPYHR